MNKTKNSGFLLISLLIVVAIAAILFALYFKKSNNSETSTYQAGQKGIEQAKENNANQYQQQIEMQNEINSIGN